MTHNATITAKKHADIHGREQLYLIINTNDKPEGVVINIGNKTFASITKLLTPNTDGKTKTTTGNKLEK